MANRPDPRNDVLQATLTRLDSLNDGIADLSNSVQDLRSYGRRNRHVIWALAISLALDLVLTAFVTFFSVTATQASSEARHALHEQYVSCLQLNKVNASRVTFFDAAVTSTPGQTKAEVDRGLLIVSELFPQQHCIKP